MTSGLRGHIMDGVEASLRRLQTDHMDPYQIHGNDSVTQDLSFPPLARASLS
jgi:aryl-alcohol dehydrogenase-like predicted oxidoreductase